MCDKRVRRRCRRPIRTSSERRETRKHIHHIHTCKERVNAAFSPRTRKIAYKYRYIDIHTHTNKHIYIYIYLLNVLLKMIIKEEMRARVSTQTNQPRRNETPREKYCSVIKSCKLLEQVFFKAEARSELG